ncbi:MAG TPA: class I SAM-dependent methyltransferase [Thermoplasmata archaeon]|nr:class I SAM-dependent methyltransferase [Thermoplasmata archaeon]
MAAYGRFAKYYDEIYHGLVSYDGDCDYLESLFRTFANRRPTSILDLGCGTGNHALELARRDYEVTGLDLSASQLRVARGKARGSRAPVRFVRGDMARFDLHRRFDAGISMFGGFGYMLTDRQLASHFASVRRHLVPGGIYAFEFWHLPAAIDRHQGWVYRDRPHEIIRLDESRVDRHRSRLTMSLRFFVLDRNRVVDRFQEVHTVRLYTVPEMRTILARAGFRLLAAYSGTPAKKGFSPVRRDTFRVTAVVRPEGPKRPRYGHRQNP